jgi:mannosyltransferase OCH1-like enzyme
MINKIIHQIWIGTYNIPQRELALSKEVKEKHDNYEYYLWTDNNLPNIPERLQEMYNVMYNKQDFVYCADMIRWLVVYEYGGWYLDIDFEYVRSLDYLNIDNRDGILFGHWGGGSQWLDSKIGEGWSGCDYTFANNVFGFKKNHPLVKHMIDSMPVDINYGNAPYSPGWTGIEGKRYLGLENEFTKNVWEYHDTMKKYLNDNNIQYGDYNTFQNEILKHYALYSWSHENKEKFKNGLIL